MWSRFFAPWAGITEDPVTGSLHAILGPYWSKRLRAAGGDAGSHQEDQVSVHPLYGTLLTSKCARLI